MDTIFGMDVVFVRMAVTVLCFTVFIGIVLWAWSAHNKAQFEKAAMLPFTEDDGRGEGGLG